MNHPHQKEIDATRRMLDFAEAHPDVYMGQLINGDLYATTSPEEFPSVVALMTRELGGVKKDATDQTFHAIADFGGRKIRFFTDREAVCVRKVVGTKVIPAEPERVVTIGAKPERVVEIVEWECADSLLAPRETEPTSA